MAFEYDEVVQYSKCNRDAQLTTTALINYCQDVATYQSDSIGVGVYYLMPLHKGWFTISWQIDVLRMPKYLDRITLGTIVYQNRGSLAGRNCYIKDENGDYMVKVDSVWAFADSETGKMCRLLPEVTEAYTLGEPLEMEHCGRKIEVEAEMEDRPIFTIGPDVLDSNGHVNNGQYVAIAERRYLPQHFPLARLRVEYKVQLHEGDRVLPKVGSLTKEDGTTVWYVQYYKLTDDGEELCCQMSLQDKI